MNTYTQFTEFMHDYIQIQTDDEVPWCMSFDMLLQAYETFLFKVKKVNGLLFTDFDKNVYNNLTQYISENTSNVNILGSFNEHSVPKMTITGIRLKKVPVIVK
jgi:hypothetical protein